MTQKLTLQAAKEYVRGYYQSLEGRVTGDIEGCDIEARGLVKVDGLDVVKLNVTETYADGQRCLAQWDVWLEPDGVGGFTLMGEY